jgi:hypothetical protein
MAAMVERGRNGSCVGLFRLIPCERIDHTLGLFIVCLFIQEL